MDIQSIRNATPGCARVTHFNHAGASLPCAGMFEVIAEQLRQEAQLGPMEASAAASERIAQVRQSVAALLGANADEIALTGSASDSWGIAFAALPPFRSGDRILVGRHEWGGNLSTMRYRAEREGARIETIACNEDGSVSAPALAGMLDERVKLVALTWLPANGGLINDAAAIGRVLQGTQIPYFIDAAQAVGQLEIDVRAIHCDVLGAPGRKFLRGPCGTGLLYVRSQFLPRLRPAYFDVAAVKASNDEVILRDDSLRFEFGVASSALQLGLGYAVDEALRIGVAAIRQRIDALAQTLRARLADIRGVHLHDLGLSRSGLISFTVDDRSAIEVRRILAAQKINVAVNGVAYTPLDMAARGLQDIVRASLSYFTSEDEIERLAHAVEALANGGR